MSAESKQAWRERCRQDAECVERIREQRRRYRTENLEQEKARIRRTELVANFGITPERYDSMLAEQAGVCAICLRPERATRNGIPKRLAVDHDHRSGDVRALLCSLCNTALGQFNDDPTLLRKAADYLEAHGDQSGSR